MENYFPIVFDNAGTGFSVTNTGTAPSPCVITLIPKVSLLYININGLSDETIKITNVSANSVIVIDGENKTFTINGLEAWSQYEAWEFPKLQPGVNNITITNGAQIDVEIAYSVRYI